MTDPTTTSSPGGMTAILASLTIAGKASPPSNGRDVIIRLEQSFHSLALTDFTLTEFCVKGKEQDTSRAAALKAKLSAAAVLAPTVSPSSPQSSAKSAPSVKAEPIAGDLTPAGLPLCPDPADVTVLSYAPPTISSTANSLSNFTSLAVVHYLDPITEVNETDDFRRKRALAQTLLEHVFAPNHAHVFRANTNGDIAAIWSAARALCIGDVKASRLDTITSLVDMARHPPSTWTELACLLNQLQQQLASEMTQSTSGMELGTRLLPEFALRALQSSNFDHLRVDIAMLHKVQGNITLPRILHDIGTAHSLTVGQPAQHRALAADAPTPTTSTRSGVCFAFRDHGSCRNHNSCRFRHIDNGPTNSKPSQLSGACYECGKTSHGMRDCPVRLKRRQLQTTQSASIAAQTVEVARLTALLATTPPPRQPPLQPSPSSNPRWT